MTKKEERRLAQIAENKAMESVVSEALKIWNINAHGDGKQLRHMQASIFTIGKFTFLVSYETLAAFIYDGEGFDILRMFTFYKEWIRFEGMWGYVDRSEYTNYSPTSGKQISAFFSEYKVNKIHTYRNV